MKAYLSALAQQELRDASAYYELAVKGLGIAFRQEVREAIKRIRIHPRAWVRERGEIRKCLLHKFPYKILYAIENEEVWVVAIAHQHRDPDYWINRIKEKG